MIALCQHPLQLGMRIHSLQKIKDTSRSCGTEANDVREQTPGNMPVSGDRSGASGSRSPGVGAREWIEFPGRSGPVVPLFQHVLGGGSFLIAPILQQSYEYHRLLRQPFQ